jgi:hypothetical protein
MTDQFVLDFYAAALVTLATYPTVKMMRVTARDARLAVTAAARKRAEKALPLHTRATQRVRDSTAPEALHCVELRTDRRS